MAENDELLMIPGPIQPSKEVMAAMGGPVQAHYGADFTRTYNETTAMLKKVYQTRGDIYLFAGPGTTAIEAALGSAVSSGEKIIVGVNGFFGERLKAIAEAYRMDVVEVKAEWGQPLQADLVEKAVLENPDAKMVAMTHLETSTTIANSVEAVGQITRRHGLLLMVDAVSSLGGMPLKMDEWGIDLCASASQKCLGAPPGLAPLAVSARAWEAIDRDPHKGHGFYLDLRVWRKYATEWADWHPFPITISSNLVQALKVGLDALLEEGVEKRMVRYRQLALRLRDGLQRIGMAPFTPQELMVPVITAAYGPPGVATSRIVAYMGEKHHIKIAGGLGAMKDKIIRVGHMSPLVSEDDIDRVVAALGEFS
jgi:alanine-glyoxylate transaminase / serine-glyoxylate transaminase / serine-pyruvate transaminase